MSDYDDRDPDTSVPSLLRTSQFYTSEGKWTFITIHSQVLCFLEEKLKCRMWLKYSHFFGGGESQPHLILEILRQLCHQERGMPLAAELLDFGVSDMWKMDGV